MMPGPKTNEREGTRAVLRYAGVSAYKVREVIDAIRGRPVHEAADLLNFVERDCAQLVGKLLQSAVANASNNDGLEAEELYVSACYVDEGPTAKRWRPRARGRATRVRKRSSHITVIVSRLPDHELARLQARRRAENLTMRARRVEATRRARSEVAEGASRRERRHPEAFPAEGEAEAEAAAAAEAPVAEGAPTDETEAADAELAVDDEAAEDEAAEDETAVDEVAEDEATEATPADEVGAPDAGDQEKDS